MQKHIRQRVHMSLRMIAVLALGVVFCGVTVRADQPRQWANDHSRNPAMAVSDLPV